MRRLRFTTVAAPSWVAASCPDRPASLGCGPAATLARAVPGLALGLLISAPALARYRRLAMTDPLTGLLNRRGLRWRTGWVLPETAPSDGWPPDPPVLVLDLVGFKNVNARYGYQAGDRFLLEFSRRLRARAPRGSCVARLGGDEFAVVVGRQGNSPAGRTWDVQAATLVAALRRDLRIMSEALAGTGACQPLHVDILSMYPDARFRGVGTRAPLAQSAERLHGKEKVYGSIP